LKLKKKAEMLKEFFAKAKIFLSLEKIFPF